jgi:hypothetical protein
VVRYERRVENYLGFVRLGCIVILLKVFMRWLLVTYSLLIASEATGLPSAIGPGPSELRPEGVLVGPLPPTGEGFVLDLQNIFRYDDSWKLVEATLGREPEVEVSLR